MTPLTSLTDISSHYDAFLIDLWGVIHDGTQMYEGAAAALAHLHQAGKPVCFLSNAPRTADKAIRVMDALGVPRAHYAHLVTSGQVAHDWLKSESPWGKNYYYLGPGKDEDILNGLDYQSTTMDKAGFILNTGFESDFQPEADILPTLEKLLSLKLPLLCVNPDMEVVKQDGTRMLCAGWVAQAYQQMGGTVTLIGKPYAQVYNTTIGLLGADKKILAIGDNLHTDIKGAQNMGLDSLLITGGILKSEHGTHPSPEKLAALCHQASAAPTYVAQAFSL